MSCFSLSSSGSSFYSFNPRRDDGHLRKQRITKKMHKKSIRSMMDRRRNSSGGDFDEDENNNKEDNKEGDPDEIAFLSS